MRKLLFGIVLSACLCGPLRAQQATPLPILVGAAMPQSGILADIAADFRKGLLLWQEEVNAAGGLLGRRVELQLLDDHSEAAAAGKLYEQLILAHKAEEVAAAKRERPTSSSGRSARRRRSAPRRWPSATAAS